MEGQASMTEIKEICKKVTDKVFNEMRGGLDTIGVYGAKCADEGFWEGFDACLQMVLNHLDNTDPHTLPIILRDDILEEAELYKKDG